MIAHNRCTNTTETPINHYFALVRYALNEIKPNLIS